MKISGLIMVLFVLTTRINAQQVIWSFTAKRIIEDSYELHLTARIESPWHIYSQFMEEGGPIPTKITFNDNSLFIKVDSVKEKGFPVTHHDDVFNVNVKYYSDSVDFVKVVKLKSHTITNLSGTVKYMICTNEQCMPPTVMPFVIQLK